VLGFDSTRKRMTVIVRNTNDNLIYVMCKGADSVLLPLLKDKDNPKVKALVQQTFHFMDDYAKDGLRTLLFVEKMISEEEYTEWMLQYNRASLSMIDRESEVEQVCKKIETNFDLVGSTAIEDKL
jgi:magnesium-transporting ATPase (P-type)